MGKDRMYSQLNSAADIIRRLDEELVAAVSDDCDADLMRIATQEGLAEEIVRLVMDRLFVSIRKFVMKLRWDMTLRQKFEAEKWLTDWRQCGAEFAAKALDHFSIPDQWNSTLQSSDLHCYELVMVERDISTKALCRRLYSGDRMISPMEVVEAAPDFFSASELVSAPASPYKGWVLSAGLFEGKLTASLDREVTVHKAGSLFLTRIK